MLRSPVFHAIAGIAIFVALLAFLFWPLMVKRVNAVPPPAPAAH